MFGRATIRLGIGPHSSYHLFHHSCHRAHCLNHLLAVKPRPDGATRLRTRGHDFELPTIKCEFSKRSFIVRSLFNYEQLCVLFTCIIYFLLYCRPTYVRMSHVLNSYLLPYCRKFVVSRFYCFCRLFCNVLEINDDNDLHLWAMFVCLPLGQLKKL